MLEETTNKENDLSLEDVSSDTNITKVKRKYLTYEERQTLKIMAEIQEMERLENISLSYFYY
jgi:hypothetical protein